jgi:hypothetical protein
MHFHTVKHRRAALKWALLQLSIPILALLIIPIISIHLSTVGDGCRLLGLVCIMSAIGLKVLFCLTHFKVGKYSSSSSTSEQ